MLGRQAKSDRKRTNTHSKPVILSKIAAFLPFPEVLLASDIKDLQQIFRTTQLP